jgi:hypothetical protein
MLPAYHVPLTDDQFKLIGEICAIQGQIEWMMLTTVREALGIPKELALRIMGSSAIGTNADIWIRCVRKKQRNKFMLAMAQRAFDEIKDLAEGRNDFVHAAYFARDPTNPDFPFVYFAEEGLPAVATGNEAVAVRVRNDKTVPINKLKEVREKAAEISVRIAHVNWVTIIQRRYRDWQSPWLDRLSELPPLDFPKPVRKLATKRKSPPKSSSAKR